MAKGKKEKKERGRNDVESSFVVIFAPPARKNSKRRRKREGREKEKGERVFLPGGVSHERSATIKRLRPR